jgi:GT2 family glycosyltransferase
MQEPLVYVIILNWNGKLDTVECIQSIKAQKDVTTRIIFVDNGSQDGSVPYIAGLFPEIEIIAHERNVGFQGGMNSGIRQALSQGGEYIFILNNDTTADANMLARLLHGFDGNIGITAPLIYYSEKRDKIWSCGGMINTVLLDMPPFSNTCNLPSSGPVLRDFVTSCAFLVKRDTFEKTGLFDEQFFPIYYDDLDFCLRVRRAGYQIALIPQAVLWHKVSLSAGGEYSPRERYLMGRNSAIYFRKHMRAWQAPIIILYRLASAFLWVFRLARRRKFQALKAYLTGLRDGWLKRVPGGQTP